AGMAPAGSAASLPASFAGTLLVADLCTRGTGGQIRQDVGGQVLRLDPTTDTVVQTLADPLGLISSLGSNPVNVQTDPSTQNIYVAVDRASSDKKDTIVVFDPAGNFLRYVPLPAAVAGM